MLQKKLLLFAFLFAPLCAVAQHSVGTTTIKPYVGLSYASMFNGDLDFRRGLTVGVDMEKRLAKWFAVSAGAAYAPLGGKYNYNNGTGFIWKHDYLTIPITANFYPVKGLAFKVGLQPGISIRSREESLDNKFLLQKDMKGDVKPFDLAIPVGISYELYNVVLDVRWNIGIMNIGESHPWEHNYHMYYSHLDGANFAYVFTLGYQFEL